MNHLINCSEFVFIPWTCETFVPFFICVAEKIDSKVNLRLAKNSSLDFITPLVFKFKVNLSITFTIDTHSATIEFTERLNTQSSGISKLTFSMLNAFYLGSPFFPFP